MIQRKQTLFLALSLALMLVMFWMPLGIFAGPNGVFELNWHALVDVSDETAAVEVYSVYALSVFMLTISALDAIAIFLFKRRPVQMRVCGINVTAKVGLTLVLVFLNYRIGGDLEMEWHFTYAMLLPLLGAVLNIFAYKNISDDEALVRSLDRLR